MGRGQQQATSAGVGALLRGRRHGGRDVATALAAVTAGTAGQDFPAYRVDVREHPGASSMTIEVTARHGDREQTVFESRRLRADELEQAAELGAQVTAWADDQQRYDAELSLRCRQLRAMHDAAAAAPLPDGWSAWLRDVRVADPDTSAGGGIFAAAEQRLRRDRELRAQIAEIPPGRFAMTAEHKLFDLDDRSELGDERFRLIGRHYEEIPWSGRGRRRRLLAAEGTARKGFRVDTVPGQGAGMVDVRRPVVELTPGSFYEPGQRPAVVVQGPDGETIERDLPEHATPHDVAAALGELPALVSERQTGLAVSAGEQRGAQQAADTRRKDAAEELRGSAAALRATLSAR